MLRQMTRSPALQQMGAQASRSMGNNLKTFGKDLASDIAMDAVGSKLIDSIGMSGNSAGNKAGHALEARQGKVGFASAVCKLAIGAGTNVLNQDKSVQKGATFTPPARLPKQKDAAFQHMNSSLFQDAKFSNKVLQDIHKEFNIKPPSPTEKFKQHHAELSDFLENNKIISSNVILNRASVLPKEDALGRKNLLSKPSENLQEDKSAHNKPKNK